jgi:hypothetical protein
VNHAADISLSDVLAERDRNETAVSPMEFSAFAVGLGVAGLAVVLFYSLMPDSILLLVPLYGLFTIISSRYERFPLYYFIVILTLIRFFMVPDLTIYSMSIGFRFADQESALLKYADELAYILCLQQFLVRTKVFTRVPVLLSSMKTGKYVRILFLVGLFSAVMNLVPPTNILYFSTNWFRAFLIFAYIFILPWNEKQVLRFIGFLLTLAFVFQWGGALAVNWSSLLEGEWFWIDNFTGTFMFPLCEWAAFLLAISLFMFLAELFVTRKWRYAVLGGAALFGILSAQVGTMTLMLFVIVASYFGFLFLRPAKFGLTAFKSRGIILLGLAGAVAVVFLVVNSADDDSKQGFTVKYADVQFRRRVLDVSGINEIPKVLAYVNLGTAMLNREVNPLWGAGPAMYLTSTGQSLNVSPLVDKYGAASIFGGEMTGQAESQIISVPGLIGELGFIGLVAYLALLVGPFRFLWKRRKVLFNTRWHGMLLGAIGSFIFLLAYAAIQTAFDGWVEVSYNLCFAAGLIVASEIRATGRDYDPWTVL